MRLFIEATDVWLFRDGRPFDVFAGHRANTLFPPLPTVIQGMIRSAHITFSGATIDDYLSRNHELLNQEIGPPSAPPPFKLHGPFVAQRIHRNGKDDFQRYFPRPADCFLSGSTYKTFAPYKQPSLRFKQSFVGEKEHQIQLLWRDETKTEKQEIYDDWLNEDELLNYLKSRQVAKPEKPHAIFDRENRIGIAMHDDIRRPRDGFIYEIEYARLHRDFGLEVEVDHLPEKAWPPKGILRAGGDGRSARFESYENRKGIELPISVHSPVKVYFGTPTFFKHGWVSEDWSQFFEGAPKLIAAALSKPLVLGGIDLHRAERGGQPHKPARRFVPAGSVYYFEGIEKIKAMNICDRAPDDSPTDQYGSLSRIGFGQFFIGEWNYV